MESQVLSWLSIPEVWVKYSPLLRLDWFSPENRIAVSKALQMQKPVLVPGVLTPAWSETSQKHLEDWLVRCQLKELQAATQRAIASDQILTPQALDQMAERYRLAVAADETRRIIEVPVVSAARRYPTGLKFLTKALSGGLSPGELCLIAAAPGDGKTHWLIKLASNYLTLGFRVVHVITEDLPGDVLRYYRSALARRQPGRKISLKKDLCLFDCSGDSCNTDMVAQMMKSAYDGSRPTVLVVDYLDALTDRHTEERLRQRNMADKLRRIANDYRAILLTATQGTADMWGMSRVTMANLSESKIGKASVADVILMWTVRGQQGRLTVAKARGRRSGDREFQLNVDWDTFDIGRC